MGWKLPKAGGRENGEFSGCRVSFWKDGKVLEVDGGDVCTAL